MSPAHASSLNLIGSLKLQARRRPQVEWTPAPAPIPLASLVPQVLARYGIENRNSTAAPGELGTTVDLRG